MKIVIETNTGKREFDDAWDMCIDTRDLRKIGKRIKKELKRRKKNRSSFGWFTVEPGVKSVPSSSPKKW